MHVRTREPLLKFVEQLKGSGALDELFSTIDSGEVELTRNGDLVPALVQETPSRGLAAEMTAHLGCAPGLPHIAVEIDDIGHS